jgi:hypothetical protein
MDLSPFLDSLHRDLSAALVAAGPETARGGEQLLTALEPATRLMLLEVLSEAAAEITAALGDVAVDIRLRGRDADIVVTPTVPNEPAMRPEAPDPGDGDTARITLRLPEQLKAQAEQAAAAEGASVNSWLVRAVSAALRPTSPGGFSPPYSGRGRRITGFAQG